MDGNNINILTSTTFINTKDSQLKNMMEEKTPFKIATNKNAQDLYEGKL